MATKSKAPTKRSTKPAAKRQARKSPAKAAPRKRTQSQPTQQPTREVARKNPEFTPAARAAEQLACYTPQGDRTTQAIPSNNRVRRVALAIKGRRPADVLGGKTAAEDSGLRLGFATLKAAEDYAAGRTTNREVPIETRRAMSALAQRAAAISADGLNPGTPSQTKVSGRVLVAILVGLARNPAKAPRGRKRS